VKAKTQEGCATRLAIGVILPPVIAAAINSFSLAVKDITVYGNLAMAFLGFAILFYMAVLIAIAIAGVPALVLWQY